MYHFLVNLLLNNNVNEQDETQPTFPRSREIQALLELLRMELEFDYPVSNGGFRKQTILEGTTQNV